MNAQPVSWNPNTVKAATGDVVRWNFPEATAGVPARRLGDRARRGAGLGRHQVTDEVVRPAAPPVSAHARRGRDLDLRVQDPLVRRARPLAGHGRHRPRVGPRRDSAGSGVDFTEYSREQAADPVRSDNTEGDDPFETSFTVSAPGDTRRRVPLDRQRRQPGGDKSVEFSIAAADPDAPTVRGVRRPVDGRGAAAGAVLGHRPRPAEPPADLRVGLRRRRRLGQPEPAAHVHAGRAATRRR